MKKLKNKFIIGTILLIIFIVFSQIFRAYFSNIEDTNSYLSLIKGKATLNESFVSIGENSILASGDTVRTIGKESLAVIEWGDGSITRLGGNTKISVGNNEVSRDYTKIDISFDLIAGKTWSNVVSFISGDSSFTQTFAGVEAGVRGTTFDVDLEKLFVNVTNHEITLTTNSGEEIRVSEKTPFSLENFDFIELKEFLQSFQDSGWNSLNTDLDVEQLSTLKEQIEAHLTSTNPFDILLQMFSIKHSFVNDIRSGVSYDDLRAQIEVMTVSQKQGVYEAVFSDYQKLNFVDVADNENYDDKLLYKRILLLLANDTDKKRLLETTLYDFTDAIKNQNISSFNQTLSLLNEHADVVKTLDVERFFSDINLIPDELEVIIGQNFQHMQEIFEGGKIDFEEVDFSGFGEVIDTGIENIGTSLSDVEKEARESLEEGIENLFPGFSN